MLSSINSKFKLLTGALLVSSYSLAQINPFPPAQVTTATHEFKYTNPITRDTAIAMRDHCIIKVGSKWYCTGIYCN